MAANNLRIVYDNVIDYTTTRITASSTGSTSLLTSNLRSDIRGLIWRTATSPSSFNFPAILKNTTSLSISGVHSNLTITATVSSGSPGLFGTFTATGATEASSATALPITTTVTEGTSVSNYVLRIYDTTSKSTLLNMETVPVVLSNTTSTGVFNVILTNQWHRIPGNTDSAIMSNSGTNIIVLDSQTPMRYAAGGTTVGAYAVSIISATGITAGSITSAANAPYVTVSDHSGPTAATSTIVYQITGRNFDNVVGTSTVTQTCVLSLNTSTAYYSVAVTCTPSISRAVIEIENLPNTGNYPNMIGLTYSNLNYGSTMRVMGYSAQSVVAQTGTLPEMPTWWTTSTRRTYDIPAQICVPFTSVSAPSHFSTLYNTNTYGLDKQLARVYLPAASQAIAGTIVIEIIDYNNANRYIEGSRLICGKYWSPTYNTEFGLSASFVDTSDTSRSEAGDIITSTGIVYKTMNFNLNYLTKTDRNQLIKIFRERGKRRPIFISLFPENIDDWEKESFYQMFGKLSDTVAISHPYFEFFASAIQIEEV